MADQAHRSGKLTLALLVLIAVLLIANVCMTSMLLKQGRPVSPAAKRSLPCEAVPVRFVLDEPECADKLLKAMNVTRARILPSESNRLRQNNKTVAEQKQ